MIGYTHGREASERHKRVKYSSTFSPFAVAVAAREYSIAVRCSALYFIVPLWKYV